MRPEYEPKLNVLFTLRFGKYFGVAETAASNLCCGAEKGSS
jgi:hypothetical protein